MSCANGWGLLKEYTKSDSLIKHALAIEAAVLSSFPRRWDRYLAAAIP